MPWMLVSSEFNNIKPKNLFERKDPPFELSGLGSNPVSLPGSNSRRKHAELNGEFFDDRSTSDPEFDGLRNRSPLFRRLFDQETVIKNLFFWDESEFRRVNGKKGARLILPVAEGEAMMKRQRRYKQSRPPPIQIMLSQAHYMKFLMEKKPDLTRADLAGQFEVTPSYLTRIMNLLSLAPEIQEYIRGLPPSLTKGAITESRLKGIARIQDKEDQKREFWARFGGAREFFDRQSDEAAPESLYATAGATD